MLCISKSFVFQCWSTKNVQKNNVFRRKSGIDWMKKSTGRWLNEIIITIDVPHELRPYISASTVAHEVSPCLTLAFETIDKTRLRNSLAEYVTHLPRMINLSAGERRAVSEEEAPTTKSYVGKQTRWNVLCLSSRVIGNTWKSQCHSRERARETGPGRPVRETRWKLRLKFNSQFRQFRFVKDRGSVKTKSLLTERLL